MKTIYDLPHYYYEVRVDDKIIFGSSDDKRARKIFTESKKGYVELIRLKNGDFDKVMKEKDLEN